MSVVKQIIELSLKEKETEKLKIKRNLEGRKYYSAFFELFYNWKKCEKEKLIEKEKKEEDNYNIETNKEYPINNNNDF
ncbi:hypothetical protein H8356DRAFT_1328780 [Neocallimastix lanati (nom. inval.)]|nr:hypothetical protein H8356DRAFT_1328780 [Neocallimastix sp. JGI-2020a]